MIDFETYKNKLGDKSMDLNDEQIYERLKSDQKLADTIFDLWKNSLASNSQKEV